MKIHKSTYQQMDELFKEARQDKPVMSLNEVDKVIHTGVYIPGPGVAVKGFHIGTNTLIIVGGIVISSLLTFFTLRKDHSNIESPKPAITNNSVQQIAPAQNQSVVSTPTPIANNRIEPAIKKADKQRPVANSNKLLASNSNKISSENAVVEYSEENAMVGPSENTDLKAGNNKTVTSEFNVKFNHNAQKVKMMLDGDEVMLLSVDGRVIEQEEYSRYDDLISEGKIILAGQRTHAEEANSLGLVSFFDKHLHSDKILFGDSQYIFELTSSQLLINKAPQSDDVFKRYKKLYEDKTGKVVTEGSVYKFEKGKSE